MIHIPMQPAMAPGLAMLSRPEKPRSIPPVTGGNAAGETSLQSNQNQGQNPPTELQRHLAQNQPNERLVGPPPSFRANVLEVEADLKFAIQQLEVKREKFRNADAAAANNQPERSDAAGRAANTGEPPAAPPDRADSQPARAIEKDALT